MRFAQAGIESETANPENPNKTADSTRPLGRKGTFMATREWQLDDLDRAIIGELQKNGRESYKNIGKRLGVSDGTIRYRAERMVKSGYLRISASVNPMHFPNSLTALVGVTLENRANRDMMEKIAGLSGVQSVVNVSGKYDLMLEVFVESRQDLHRFLVDELSGVGGVTASESFIYLDAVNKWVEQRGA